MQVNRIQSNNNQTFQSRITPKFSEAAGDFTKDYWTSLAKYCHESNQMPRLRKILDKLYNNGDSNILTLECEPKNECGVTNYFVRLYENIADLRYDRQKEKLTQRKKSIAEVAWIQDCDGNVYKLGKVSGSTKTPYSGPYGAEKSIMDALENIVKEGSEEYKSLFSSVKVNADKFLDKYRH